jgi:hypothetical protein
MPDIAEELSEIKQQLAILITTGNNTLAECRKTNGRVTKLEESHNALVKDLAVLDALTTQKMKFIDKDLDSIVPKVVKNNAFIDTLKGNWQGIMMVVMVIGYILDKFLK